ncbi:hypothetical protein [Streptomyces sp. NPDC101115]|uniref:hypothetical protein n=1 Tax=Streptomyces sp. NPDC101115 TaxID=3366106 RepID=UPI00381C0E1B
MTEETLCRVRRRTDEGIEACVRALADVHRHDGYPLDWPARPADWLRGDPVLGAWVGELDGRPVAHVTLPTAAEDDLAPAARSERTGAARDATAVLGRLVVAPRARGRRPAPVRSPRPRPGPAAAPCTRSSTSSPRTRPRSPCTNAWAGTA